MNLLCAIFTVVILRTSSAVIRIRIRISIRSGELIKSSDEADAVQDQFEFIRCNFQS